MSYLKSSFWGAINMDAEKIVEWVDGFMDQLTEEFNQLGKEITANAEHAVREVEALGLSQEDAPRLVFDIADPMGSIQTSQERCQTHVGNIFDVFERLDPEEERLARIMIRERLCEFHSEISSLFSSGN